MIEHLLSRCRLPRAPSLRACRPRIEALEDRVALSTTLSTLSTYPTSGVNLANGVTAMLGQGLAADSRGDVFGTVYYYKQGPDGLQPNGFSTVFELAKGSKAFKTVATFQRAQGAPDDLLVDASGNIYGTTGSGGPNYDGTVFKIAAGHNTVTTLATFNYDPYATPPAKTEGFTPGHLLLSNGTLYGTTEGGGVNGYGTVFSLPIKGGTPKTLAAFNGTNGSGPDSLTLSGNRLYGTTKGGGKNQLGTMFSLPAAGGPISVLTTFNSYGVVGAVAVSNGFVYGVGAFGTPFNGSVYKVAASGGPVQVTGTFNGGNGSFPVGLMNDGGSIVGITQSGGKSLHYGTVFMVNSNGSINSLVSFSGGSSGGAPSFMTVGNDGNVYGFSQTTASKTINIFEAKLHA